MSQRVLARRPNPEGLSGRRPARAPPPCSDQCEPLGKVAAHVAEEAETLSPFAQRYLSTSGGRLGNTTTRQQLYEIAQDYAKSGKYTELEGDGQAGEELIPGAGPGTKGGTFVDFTAKAADGTTVRIQTIKTLADGVAPTRYEAAAAARIRAAFPNDKLLLIPKRTR